MTRSHRSWCCVFVMFVLVPFIGCQLRRPNTVPSRMIEPNVLEPPLDEQTRQLDKAASAIAIRLLDTQAREHIGRRVIHRRPNGELAEDPTWFWASPPDRYLDTALRLELGQNPDIRLVDTGDATTLAATLLVWDLESDGEMQLVGEVEFQAITTDRKVHSKVIRGSEPVKGELPGDLAVVAGRLMRRLASQGLALAHGIGEQ
jgi:hypothetical protein